MPSWPNPNRPRTPGPRSSFTAGGSGGGASSPLVSSPRDSYLLKTACINFPNPSGSVSGDWKPYSGVLTDPMCKGANWQVWRDGVFGMAGSSSGEFIESVNSGGYDAVTINGTTYLNYCASHDLALLGHAPPLAYLDEIRNRSKGRTKVGVVYANFQQVSQETPFNPWWQPLETVVLAHLRNTGIEQTGSGAVAGCFFADVFQTTLSPAQSTCGTQSATRKPHTWVADLVTGIGAYADAWFSTLSTMILSRYGSGGLDYIVVDEVLPSVFWGAASNPDPAVTDALYRAGWTEFWNRVPSFETLTGTKMIGNSPLSSLYTNSLVKRRYGEHFFHDEQTFSNTTSETLAQWRPRLEACLGLDFMSTHCQIRSTAAVYNIRSYTSTHVDGWSGTDGGPGGVSGTWEDVRMTVWRLGMQEKYHALTGRGGTTFPLFWQKEFKRPQG